MGVSKIQVRKFSIKFSKVQAKKLSLERVLLDKILKNLESNMNNHEEYNDFKTQLEQIYKIKANGTSMIRARRKILKILSKPRKKSCYSRPS